VDGVSSVGGPQQGVLLHQSCLCPPDGQEQCAKEKSYLNVPVACRPGERTLPVCSEGRDAGLQVRAAHDQ